MRTVRGDIVALLRDGVFDVIVHGCNCRASMAGGLARQVAKAWPEAEEADRRYDGLRPGHLKAGTILPVQVVDGVVVNAYTQIDPGPNADMDLIRQAMWKVRVLYLGRQKRIAMPKIGCGIGGLDWKDVEPIVSQETKGIDLTIVEYDPSPYRGFARRARRLLSIPGMT